MRTEQEMMALILGEARADDRIRAVLLEGSRTDPNARRDVLQDYDIAYIVTETAPFWQDVHWIDRFGTRLYMQRPDDFPFEPGDRAARYAWLMQFEDGVRLDLQVMTLEYALKHDFRESLCRVLLDKHRILPPHSLNSDRDFWTKKPTQAEFAAVCNEFWWCMNNVAKGIRRGEDSYVQDMTNAHVRPQLMQLLCWKAGLRHGWSVSPGKMGKRLPQLLPEADWADYRASFFRCEPEEMWEVAERMARQFAALERELAEALRYSWNEAEARGSTEWLRRVRAMASIHAE